MIQIRRGVFETNSSSTHSICVCTEQQYKDFEDGKLYYDCGDDRLITPEEAEEYFCLSKKKWGAETYEDCEIFDWERLWDRYWEYLEKYDYHFQEQ